MMSNFNQQLSQKLMDCGATQEQLNVCLYGHTHEEKMKNFSTYLASKCNTQKVETLRSFIMKGSEKEILSKVKAAQKDLSEIVFKE